MSPEYQLLLHCMRSGSCGCPADVDRFVSRGDVDWDIFIEVSLRHKLLPLVADVCGKCASVPQDVAAELNRRRTSILTHNLALVGVLNEVSKEFAAREIPVITFKGPALAMSLHGGLASRQFSDIDVLVRPEAVREALASLEQIGFQVSGPAIQSLGASRLQRVIDRTHEVTLYRRDRRGVRKVDLHWNFSDDDSYFATDHAKLWQTCVKCPGLDNNIRILAVPARLAYLAYHAVNHQCARLSWLHDFSVAVQAVSAGELRHVISALPAAERLFVVAGLLMLEELALAERFDDVLPSADALRISSRRTIAAMREAAAGEDAVLIKSAIRTGLWRWRVTGRFTPLYRSLLKSVLPAPADLLKPGPIAPILSRVRYVAGKAATL